LFVSEAERDVTAGVVVERMATRVKFQMKTGTALAE
jgi:hypothetical protein